jgi:hypothetical protein
VRRFYIKEEEFVDEFYNWASAASVVLNEQWRPNGGCDDAQRKQQEYFMKSGEMSWLVFRSASIHDNPGEEVHAQIVLESSTRIVNVKVLRRDGKSVAEILFDKAK